MATATTLRRFNALGHSVTPIFLLMGHFLNRFSTFCKKMKKIYRVEVWIFSKMHHQIPFIWPLRLAVRQFEKPLEGLRFVKMMAIFRIIDATDPLMQNIVRTVCLCWLIFDISTYDAGDHAELRTPIYQNQTSFPHAWSLKRSRWPPIFISFLKQVYHYLSAVEVLKKSIEYKIFARTSLNYSTMMSAGYLLWAVWWES